MKTAGHIRIWLGILLALVFLVPVALTPDQARKRVFDEAEYAGRIFGEARYNAVAARANAAYNAMVVQSGLRKFIDQGYTRNDELDRQAVMDKPQRSMAAMFNAYLDAMSVQLYGLFFRGSIMLEWLFFIGLFLVGAIVDGVARRKVKMATGGLNSPVKFTWAMHTMVIIIFTPLMYLMLPVEVSPMFMPYWTFVAAAPLSIAIANAVRVA